MDGSPIICPDSDLGESVNERNLYSILYYMIVIFLILSKIRLKFEKLKSAIKFWSVSTSVEKAAFEWIQFATSHILCSSNIFFEFSFWTYIVKVWREENVFMAQSTGQRTFRIHPETESKFFVKEIPAQLEFLSDAQSKVTGLILTFGRRTTQGRKIKW